MILKFDSSQDELLARGGSFDLSGIVAEVGQQFWGFNASDGAKITAIKGVAVRTSVTNLASIRSAEVDISAILVKSLTMGLGAGWIYRADGYIITSITLADATSQLHCYKTLAQISA
jgi:hypothetical protein